MDKFFKWVGIFFIVSFLGTCAVMATMSDKTDLSAEELVEKQVKKLERQEEREAHRKIKKAEKAQKRLWEDMGVYCARLFESSSKYGTRLSFHRDKRLIEGTVYQMYWSPEHFKIKNAFGSWGKSEAWCHLRPKASANGFDVIFLKIGTDTILDNSS